MLLPVRRALLSVSDKTGLVELARALAERNIEILSTGGTAKLLAANGMPVREVSSYTGFPEIMDGRVKTLHPKIHGGLLGRRGVDEAVMASHEIEPIDLLVVNLYPFAETVARPDCSLSGSGGEHRHRRPRHVACSGEESRIGRGRRRSGRLPDAVARVGSARWPHHAGHCDPGSPPRRSRTPRATTPWWRAICGAVHQVPAERFPDDAAAGFRQGAGSAIRRKPASAGGVLSQIRHRAARASRRRRMLQGKELSFNNIADSDTAIECVRQFDGTGVRDREARESVRRGGSGYAARGVRPRVSHRSNFGFRRHHRVQPRAGCDHGRRPSSTGSSSRSWRRPRCPPRPRKVLAAQTERPRVGPR